MDNLARSTSRHRRPSRARDLYDDEFDFPSFDAQPSLEYMLAALPRSGSTFLATEMWRTGVMGAPMEYLNPLFGGTIARRLMIKDINSEIIAYWSGVRSLRTSPNGVFGHKMFISFYLELCKKCPDLFHHLAPDKVVFLTRSNLVEQAVSYSRAIRSDSWFYGVREPARPGYDEDHVLQCVESLQYQLNFWQKLFELTDTTVHHVIYEDLLDDPRGVLKGIADFLGVEICRKAAITLPRMHVQRDAESAEWVKRFAGRDRGR